MSDMETSVDDDVAIPKKNGEHIEAAEPKDKIAAIKEANKAALEKDEEMDVDENEEPTEKVNGSSTPKKHVTKEPTVMNGGSGGEDEDDALSKDGDDETANDETANNSHDDEMNEDDFSKDGHEDDTSKDVEEASKDGSVANGGNHKTDGEASHTVTDEDSVQEAIPAPPTRRTSPRKAAVNFNASLREYSSSEEEEYDVNEVEEVKDDSSDSILELEAEDPLAGPPPATTEPEKSKIGTNIVTIDDVRALQSLTNSAKKHQESEKPNVVLIDTRTILAGKNTSGVTITPAKPRVLPLGGATIGSGVTISHTSGKPMSRGVGLPMGTTMTSLGSGALSTVAAAAAAGYGALHSAGVNSGFTYDKQGQLNDPNLTDDTFVVEAPSFIVPYVYEKPPKESFGAFKESISKLLADKKKEGGEDKNDKADEEKKEKAKEEDKEEAKEKEGGGDEAKSETSENKENDKVATPVPTPEVKKPAVGSEIFFESQLGKFISNLGMNLVQEYVQQDLLREQTRKSQKDKSASVMHAIMSLKKNLESSKDKNEGFHFELRKCRYCSFRTESMLALESHMETPHMRNGLLRCNYCHFETKAAQEILVHMSNEHNIRGKLERAVAPHQCPQCPFEDSMRGKLTRHKVGCDKRFRGDRNQEPPHDWEPPAKIPKPTPYNRVGRPNLMVGAGTNPNYHPIAGLGLAGLAASRPSLPAGFQNLNQNFPPGQNQQRGVYSAMPQLQFGPRGRGRPVGTYKPGGFPQGFRQVSPGNPAMAGNRLVSGSFVNNQTVNNQASRFGQGGSSPAALLNNLGANSSVTIQSITQRNNNPRTGQPSISITPLPGRGGQASARPAASPQQSQQMALKPGQPTGQGKGGFVICEICDGYIKDLEQLRNHMQWIHKVKIHPKMIYNRPPLNCQKCQFRFFTDQGLERHLLGSHGLVTASMQDLANKGQDSGRCPVCGKVYQWKLLNHVAKDHQKTLKPAHLSYKCTVCTATFGQYKLFENHVYTAHSSGGNKKAGDKGGRQTPQQSPAASSSGAAKIASLKMSDEITIIPQAKNSQNAAATGKTSSPKAATPSDSDKKSSPPKKSENESDIIELDDEGGGEIDDVEENSESTPTPSIKATDDEPPAKKAKSDEAPEQSAETSEVDSGEEGVEEINDEDD